MITYTGLKFKFLAPTTIKSSSGGGDRIIRGYAATIDLDRQGDVISPEALAKAVEDLRNNTTVFYEHKHDQIPVGKVLDAGVDDKGLWVEVLISKTADDIWTLIQEGILNKFSIGGKVITAQPSLNKLTGQRYNLITNMELFEVSIVGLPANPAASFNQVKSISECIMKAYEREQKLSDAIKRLQGGENEMEKEIKKEDIIPQAVEATVTPETVIKTEVVELVKVEVPVEKVEENVGSIAEVKVETVKAEELKEEVVKAKTVVVPEKKEVVPVEPVAPIVEVEEEEIVEINPEDIVAIKNTLVELVAAVTTLNTAVTAMGNANKDLQKSMLEKPEPVEVEKINYEKIEGMVVKALEDKLGKIRLVPSRKGTIIKSELTLKDEEGNEDIETLMDEHKFYDLSIKEQKEIIKKGLLSVIKS